MVNPATHKAAAHSVERGGLDGGGDGQRVKVPVLATSVLVERVLHSAQRTLARARTQRVCSSGRACA